MYGTYVSRSTKLNKKEKKLYVEAMVANIFGRSLLLLLALLYSCKSWPSTTEMDENCMSSSRGCCFFDSFLSSTLISSAEEQECSTKMPGKKRMKASRPVPALTHLESAHIRLSHLVIICWLTPWQCTCQWQRWIPEWCILFLQWV